MFEGIQITSVEVLGILSLIFWSLILIVTVKYVMLVMRADNHGEGGILALMALAQRVSVGTAHAQRRWRWSASPGPACSSATASSLRRSRCCRRSRGWRCRRPALAGVRAADQRRRHRRAVRRAVARHHPGRARVRPGDGGVVRGDRRCSASARSSRHPFVLLAISPTLRGHAVSSSTRSLAFVVLGAVVLCVTGAEALYADMGHFGAHPIRLTWTFFVLPCAGAELFRPGRADAAATPRRSPTRSSCWRPHWLRLPLVILATVATVIASQAVISGAYSITRQCMQLGFLPRMTVRHTSTTEEGQIYVPQVNSALAVGVLVLVLAFKSSRQRWPPPTASRSPARSSAPACWRRWCSAGSSTGRAWPRSACSAASSSSTACSSPPTR